MKFYFFPFYILFFSILEARFALEEETDYSIEKNDILFTINKDGSYEYVSETIFHLKTESARDSQSKKIFVYREGTEKIEILDAKTILNDKEYKVSKKEIEDKQLASSANGFEDKRQIIVAFPKAEVGAKLYIKRRFKSSLVITKNHFFSNIFSLENGWMKHANIKIKSKIPLFMEINDPEKRLKVETNPKSTDKTFTTAEITLETPGTSLVVDDISGYLALKNETYMNVSSLNEWKNILKDLIPRYDEILKQDIPKLYKEIIKKTEDLKTDVDKITQVMSLLNEKIQYLGSWMTFKGMFVPRDLKEVEKTRFADCKDFSTATVVILRSLGFDAEVVFVQRGEGAPDYDGKLPLWNFNHAIVKAVGKDKTVYWLDPTNFTSSALIRPDIANRAVIVPVDHEKYESELQKTPQVNSFTYKKVDELSITKDDRIAHKINLSFSETTRAMALLTGIHLRVPPTIIEDQLYHMIAGQSVKTKDRIKTEIPTLTDRIIKPVEISLHFISDDLISSNIGKAYLAKSRVGLIEEIINIKASNVHDWHIDLPGVYASDTIIKGKHIKNLEKLSFKVETPWFKVIREAEYKDDSTIIKNTVEVLIDYIKNEDLKSDIFLDAQKKIVKEYKCFVVEIEE